jgi:hypothetical protein
MRPEVVQGAKAQGRRLYEDGSMSPKPKAGPQPNARAVERANPNAAFKRPAPVASTRPAVATRPAQPAPKPAAKAGKTLPKPPARRPY